MEMTPLAAAGAVPRHPLDPDPVRSSKARTVFALGVMAVLTGLFVGGVVPATVALSLSRQARREAYASAGYLTGRVWLDRGERLAWTGILLAASAVTIAVVLAVVDLAQSPTGQDFAPTVD